MTMLIMQIINEPKFHRSHELTLLEIIFVTHDSFNSANDAADHQYRVLPSPRTSRSSNPKGSLSSVKVVITDLRLNGIKLLAARAQRY